jgi:chromate reductase
VWIHESARPVREFARCVDQFDAAACSGAARARRDLSTGLLRFDWEAECPARVAEFQRLVAESDALLIASPEYAHGVTGTIKNALDWLVGFEPFASKAVAVLNASPRAHHADAALRETLKTMTAALVESASISIPLLGAGMDESEMIATHSVASAIRDSLDALRKAVQSVQSGGSPTFFDPLTTKRQG